MNLDTPFTLASGKFWSAVALIGCISAQGVNAAPVDLGINQTAVIKNLAGQSVNIQHVGHNVRTDYKGGQLFSETLNENHLSGMIGIANYLRLSFTGNSGASQSTVGEIFMVDVFDELVRTEARITSPGNKISIDNANGRLLGFSGAEAGTITATRISGNLVGGILSIKNLRFNLDSKTIVADEVGTGASTETSQGSHYESLNTAAFTYTDLTGPTNIPVDAFAKGKNTKLALENAGFRIWSISSTKVTFSGLYKFSKIRFTQQSKSMIANSLRLLSTPINGLNHANEDPAGLGDILVSVMFSAPIPQQ